MYYVYLLRLNNRKIYTGSTPNLDERVSEHKNGYCEPTKSLRPIRLIWYCCFEDRINARRFENYLKKGSGQAFRNKHLVNA